MRTLTPSDRSAKLTPIIAADRIGVLDHVFLSVYPRRARFADNLRPNSCQAVTLDEEQPVTEFEGPGTLYARLGRKPRGIR